MKPTGKIALGAIAALAFAGTIVASGGPAAAYHSCYYRGICGPNAEMNGFVDQAYPGGYPNAQVRQDQQNDKLWGPKGSQWGYPD